MTGRLWLMGRMELVWSPATRVKPQFSSGMVPTGSDWAIPLTAQLRVWSLVLSYLSLEIGPPLVLGPPIMVHLLPASGTPGLVQAHRWDGTQWNKVGDDFEGGNPSNDKLGPVSLSDDGNTVVVGLPGGSSNLGICQVYKWNGTDITGNESYYSLGVSVSVSGDGMTVAAGASQAGPGYAGMWRYDGTHSRRS